MTGTKPKVNGPFRLRLLFRPSYLLPRLRSISSARDAFSRAAGLARYCYFGLGSAAYGLRGACIRAGRRLKPCADETRGLLVSARSAASAPFRWFSGLRRERELGRAVSGFRPSLARVPVPDPPPPSASGARPDVMLSWNIHAVCNYDCPYCWFHGRWGEFAGRAVSLPPEEWMEHWDRFNDGHGKAEIYIAGGEPFVYPRFPELLSRLSRRNTVYVITNLAWDPADAAGLDPGKVGFSASYHCAAAGPAEVFAGKVCRLRSAGFSTALSIVAYPPYLPSLPGMVDAFMSRGINPVVQPFRGEWRGGRYPEAYSPAEKRLVAWLSRGGYLSAYPESARRRAADEAAARGGGEDFGREYLLAPFRTRGLPCNAGRDYGRLQFNGDMIRCSQGGYVGNFLEPDFSMSSVARPCPFRTCECVNEVVYVEGGPYGPR